MQNHELFSSTKWVLESCSSEVSEMGCIELQRFPFRIGRLNQIELTLPMRTVSGQHATISREKSRIYIEDNGSRNGTYVNGAKISARTLIRKGDLIQVAQAVFRVDNNDREESFTRTIKPGTFDDALAIVEFDRLITDRLIDPHYQAIVRLDDESLVGYEALARGKTDAMRSPKAMFDAAKKLQQESELSRILREVATDAAQELPHEQFLFLNSHPEEIDDPKQMIDSMLDLRKQYPNRKLVLEIHESTVTDLQQMQQIGSELRQAGIEVAYDDFGAGQARFFELIEEPPTYIKFDIRLMKDLHNASIRRRRTIEGLVRMMQDLDIECLAEGIELEEEAIACRNLGFTLAQGYYFHRPFPNRGIEHRLLFGIVWWSARSTTGVHIRVICNNF